MPMARHTEIDGPRRNAPSSLPGSTRTGGADDPSEQIRARLKSLPGVLSRRLAPGQTLFAAGDAISFAYLVTDGIAIESCQVPDGRNHVLDLLGPGDVCGLEATQAISVWEHAATALSLFAFPAAAAWRRAREDPELHAALVGSLSRRLERARRKLVVLGCLRAEQRTADFLVRLVQLNASDEGDIVTYPLGRREMADYLGLSLETVCRSLRHLRENGLIRAQSPRAFSVPDLRILRKFAARP